MAQFVIDLVEGSEALLDTTGYRRVRTGIVKDIDVTDQPDSQVLEKALLATGMPQLGSTLPGNNGSILQRIAIAGISNNMVRVRLEYEPTNFGGQPTAYYISDGTTLITEELSVHPSGTIVRVDWKGPPPTPTQAAAGATQAIVPADNVIMSVPRPLRQYRVAAIRLGTPNPSQNKSGSVNDDAWPASNPLPKGYWLIDRYETTFSRFSGYYQLSVSCSSRVTKDWMMQGILVNKSSGKYVPVAPNDLQEVLSSPYQYGVIAKAGTGIVSVGWFPLASFSGIVGLN